MKSMTSLALIGFLFLSLNKAYAQFDFISGGSVCNELSNTAVPQPAEPAKAAQAAATAGNELIILPGDGAVAFDMRAELVRASKKSVYLTGLAIHGDETGRRTAGLLMAKKKEGLDVRLTIDKSAAGRCEKGLLAELSAAGIPVRLYQLAVNSPYQPYSGMLVIDGKYAVLGMNSINGDPRTTGGEKIRYAEPPVQSSALDAAVVFFFQASDSTGTTNQKRRYIEMPAQSSALDGSVVFFFQASDETDIKK